MFNLFDYEFIRNAFIAGVLIGLMLPFVGVIVFERRMTFVADSLGHINMSGIALTIFLSSLFPILMNYSIIIILIWSILSAILIEYLRDKYESYKELSIVLVYSLAVSLTIVFLGFSGSYNASLFNLLFGNINGVTNNQLLIILILETIFFIVFIIFRKKILLLALEEEYIKLYNINPTIYKYLTMILITVAITMAIKTIGVLLISSLIIIPLLTASLLSKNLKSTIIYAIIFTEVAIVLGIFISLYIQIATSAVIVLISVGMYLIVAVFRKLKKY